MHEFQVQSDNAELTDYIIDIINHRQTVTIVKKKVWPDGFVSVTCQIATAKKRPRRSKTDVAELHNRVKKLYADGVDNSDIARQIGCSRAYISKILWG